MDYSRWFLFTVVLVFIFNLTELHAQISVLDPGKTVNPATGEMGFSLPLGVVKGVGGNDFPVNLYYQAGIQYHSEATPVGLGFSYYPGAITRKVIFAADDNIGGAGNYVQKQYSETDRQWWFWVSMIILIVIEIILTIVTWGEESWTLVSTICMIIGAVVGVGHAVLNHVTYGTHNYIAGGEHVDSYEGVGKGRGIIMGGTDDLPDIYRISTPYINGELVYDGLSNKFNLRQAGGIAVPGKSTVMVDFNSHNKTFMITLADGTRLFFEKSQKGKSFVKIYAQQWGNNEGEHSGVEVFGTHHKEVLEPTINAWFLTKVLFSNYVDGNGDMEPVNSAESNEGSWIIFEYDEIRIAARQLPKNLQGSRKGTMISYSGNLLNDVYLRWIKTANQSAEFCYTENRADDLWFTDDEMSWWQQTPEDGDPRFGYQRGKQPAAEQCKSRGDNAEPVSERRVLDRIKLYSNDGQVYRQFKFITDYTLKPNSLHSFTKDSYGHFSYTSMNPSAATLTLKAVEFLSGSGASQGVVTMQYVPENPGGWNKDRKAYPMPASIPEKVRYYIEERDVWGYYFANKSGPENSFPWKTDEEESPQAQAWSLERISFPSGCSIKWIYEPNEYDMSNRTQFSMGEGRPAKGGGIRVKSVEFENGNGKIESLNYFYTCSPTEFADINDAVADTSNSSGYVPAHPYRHIDPKDVDYRKDYGFTKGGLYTPAKVCYEMVKVAKNYDFTNNIAPDGFTVYEYTSTRDYNNGASDNVNTFGEIDNSWKRGLLKAQSVYNKDNELISKTEHTYQILEAGFHINVPATYEFVDKYHSFYPSGAIYLKSTKNIINGVETEVLNEYANNAKDLIEIESPKILRNYSNNVALFDFHSFNTPTHMPEWDWQGDFDLCKEYGNAAENDLVAGLCFKLRRQDEWYSEIERNYLALVIGKDIAFTKEQQSFQWQFSILNIGNRKFENNSADSRFSGFTMSDFNSNGTKDALIVETRSNTLQYHIFMDIQESYFDNKSLTDNFEPWDGHVFADGERFSYPMPGLTLSSDKSYLVSCAGVENVFDGPAKDLVFILNWVESNIAKFMIIVATDLNISGSFTNTYQSQIFEGKLLNPWVKDHNGYDYNVCLSSKMVDFDGDGSKNDVKITGTYNLPNNYASLRKMVLSNLRVVAGNIQFDSDTTNHMLGGSKLIKLANPFTTGINHCIGAVYPETFKRPVYVFFGLYDLLDGGLWKTITPTIVDCRDLVSFDYDGIPNSVIERKGQKTLIKETIPAYWEYPEMDTSGSYHNHILTSPCQVKTYEQKGTQKHPISSNLSVWKNYKTMEDQTKYDWKSYCSYIWNAPMTRDGISAENFTDFNHKDPQTNDPQKWKLADSISEFNNHGIPLTVAKPGNSAGKRRYSSIVYGYKGTLPIASITNATSAQCGIFTCDYDDGIDPAYFDKENGWGKGGSSFSENSCFGGYGSVYVHNAYGPTKNIKYDPTKSYIFSAWVLHSFGEHPSETRFARMAVEFHSDYPSGQQTYIGRWDREIYDLKDGVGLYTHHIKKDQLVSHLSEGRMPADIKYVRIWIGNYPNELPADININDIRFHPENALVTTTYYRPVIKAPYISFDANNNPSYVTGYDGFGRIKNVYKTDKNKFAAEPQVKIRSIDYNFKNVVTEEEVLRIIYPHNLESFKVGQSIDIWLGREGSQANCIEYRRITDANWNIIHCDPLGTNDLGYDYFKWIIPEELGGELVEIKASNANASHTDVVKISITP